MQRFCSLLPMNRYIYAALPLDRTLLDRAPSYLGMAHCAAREPVHLHDLHCSTRCVATSAGTNCRIVLGTVDETVRRYHTLLPPSLQLGVTVHTTRFLRFHGVDTDSVAHAVGVADASVTTPVERRTLARGPTRGARRAGAVPVPSSAAGHQQNLR